MQVSPVNLLESKNHGVNPSQLVPKLPSRHMKEKTKNTPKRNILHVIIFSVHSHVTIRSRKNVDHLNIECTNIEMSYIILFANSNNSMIYRHGFCVFGTNSGETSAKRRFLPDVSNVPNVTSAGFHRRLNSSVDQSGAATNKWKTVQNEQQTATETNGN